MIADLYNRGVLEGKEKVTCDLTINKPKEIEVMNCIKARIDAGITSFQSEGGGRCRTALMNYNRIEKIDNNELKTIVAMRGRNPENPSDRTAGAATEQRLEPNGQGVCNTLTSVQKDNLVLEEKPECINLYDEEGKETSFQDRIYKTDKISVAITTSFRPSYEIEKYRIRKLTPKECFRLMAVTDEDADKMLSINSNSQCYKQAGNSIVVSVLEALFRNLNIKGVKTWNEVKDNYDFYKKAEVMK